MDRLNVNYNPDILNCLANLSNDEVFTPPQLANDMLDLLPNELWSNPNAKFLDPSCKTGVFLREIIKRLNNGLEDIIPDLQERINHILKNQVFGIGITELTSLMTRRTIYCSKIANGKYSVCETFSSEDGNVYFSRIEHEWQGSICKICGASKSEYNRTLELENHAYAFIHKEIEEIFNMKFDVIIGNPPYQLNDGGGDGSSAVPLYHKFVEQAKNLNPRYIVMIIPARWYSGGRGLDDFRREMLTDERISEIHDFPETKDCFPGINIRGGVCYFLWNRNHKGNSKIVNYKNGEIISISNRPLIEEGMSTFVRYNEAISILKKVQSYNEETMDSKVSSRNPFGIPSNFSDYSVNKNDEFDKILYRSDRGTNKANKRVFIKSSDIKKNKENVDKIKVIVSKASPGGDEYPHSILTRPIIADVNSACTETYLIIDTLDNIKQAENLVSYISTKFFRFMMSLIKNTQNISKASYSLVPIQDWNESWSDEKLYKKYGLNEQEIEFIESMIKPINGMEV